MDPTGTFKMIFFMNKKKRNEKRTFQKKSYLWNFERGPSPPFFYEKNHFKWDPPGRLSVK